MTAFACPAWAYYLNTFCTSVEIYWYDHLSCFPGASWFVKAFFAICLFTSWKMCEAFLDIAINFVGWFWPFDINAQWLCFLSGLFPWLCTHPQSQGCECKRMAHNFTELLRDRTTLCTCFRLWKNKARFFAFLVLHQPCSMATFHDGTMKNRCVWMVPVHCFGTSSENLQTDLIS